MPRILHILSQRPGRTGSGVTLDAMVRGAAKAGWQQHVIVGTDTSDPQPIVGDLPDSQIHPLVFNRDTINFPLPGMSDVMPYASTVFSSMSAAQLDAYRNAWREHVRDVIAIAKPDIIHSHHIWLLSAMLKDIVASVGGDDVPIVTSCHATGLRQMELCPHLADEVRQGCSRNDRFVTLHHGHANTLAKTLHVASDRISVVGGGFNEALFHSRERHAANPGDGPSLLYAGKYSRAKGLPWLLDAVERLAKQHVNLTLHIAGSGAGNEADALRQRMETMSPRVVLHGQVDQPTLAKLMRQADVFVLPSFYEGLPLVLVEAAACGCRLVATQLPGIIEQLATPLADSLELVPLPRLQNVDEPVPADLPQFVDQLTAALDAAISKPGIGDVSSLVKPFTWTAVYQRIEKVWQQLLHAEN